MFNELEKMLTSLVVALSTFIEKLLPVHLRIVFGQEEDLISSSGHIHNISTAQKYVCIPSNRQSESPTSMDLKTHCALQLAVDRQGWRYGSALPPISL